MAERFGRPSFEADECGSIFFSFVFVEGVVEFLEALIGNWLRRKHFQTGKFNIPAIRSAQALSRLKLRENTSPR